MPEKDALIMEGETGTMDKNKVVMKNGSDITEENRIVTLEDNVEVDEDSLPTWAIVLIVLGGLLVASCLVWLICTFVCKVTNCLCSSITRICCCLFCCKCHEDDPHG